MTSPPGIAMAPPEAERADSQDSDEIARPAVLMLLENGTVPADRRVWGIATALAAAGCEVSVVCPQRADRTPQNDDTILPEVLEGVRIHRFPLTFSNGGLTGYAREYGSALWRTWRIVSRLARREQFDVVHVCNPPDFMSLAAWPALRGGASLVWDHHDLTPELFRARFGDGHRLLHRLALLVERIAFRSADVVLATNESYRRVAEGRGGKHAAEVFVVRNGPDTSRFRPVPAQTSLKNGSPLLIGYMGVMAPQDGVEYALRALALVREHRSDWHAIFAGDGDSRPELERLARDLGLSDAVEFPGWLADDAIVRMLSTCDVCLAPEPKTALNDASTMVKIAEYLAMSRPVVAFDLVESRFTAADAAVYATPNDVESFAERICELLADPHRRASMGLIGRERAERLLSWQRSASELMRAYARALRDARTHVASPLHLQ
jgi:glycosyltransferase involved in cell wall biosynthesis